MNCVQILGRHEEELRFRVSLPFLPNANEVAAIVEAAVTASPLTTEIAFSWSRNDFVVTSVILSDPNAWHGIEEHATKVAKIICVKACEIRGLPYEVLSDGTVLVKPNGSTS